MKPFERKHYHMSWNTQAEFMYYCNLISGNHILLKSTNILQFSLFPNYFTFLGIKYSPPMKRKGPSKSVKNVWRLNSRPFKKFENIIVKKSEIIMNVPLVVNHECSYIWMATLTGTLPSTTNT